MRNFLFLISALVTLNTFAQNAYNPITTPNTYRQADNPNYWKNKAPAGYWQQDVHYTIKANIDETKDIIDASEQLVYWNNSPNTLNEIYFHLYQNAFTPNSYCSELYNQNKRDITYGRYEEKGLGTVVNDLRIDGKLVKTKTFSTIISPTDFNENDIIINRVNSLEYLGKNTIIPALKEKTVFESNMMRFRVNESLIDPKFLIQYFETIMKCF